jgi:hypothetical protein
MIRSKMFLFFRVGKNPYFRNYHIPIENSLHKLSGSAKTTIRRDQRQYLIKSTMASSNWLWGNIPKCVGPKAKASGDEAITTLPALKLIKLNNSNRKMNFEFN